MNFHGIIMHSCISTICMKRYRFMHRHMNYIHETYNLIIVYHTVFSEQFHGYSASSVVLRISLAGDALIAAAGHGRASVTILSLKNQR